MLQILSMLLLSAASSSAQRLLDRKFPNYIIPVDSSQPNTAFGTQFSGHIGVWHDLKGAQQTVATELVFDFIPNVNAEWCTIEFDLAATGPFTLIPANGKAYFFVVNLLGAFVTESDTWNNRPVEAEQSYGEISIENGVAIGSALVPCGQSKVQVVLQADLEGDDFDFTWFELDDREKNNIVNGVTLKQWASV